MKDEKYRLLCVAVLGSCAGIGSAAQAESTFSANIGVTSNYVWRGATQTNNGAAVQGGLDYEHSTGVYVGTWLSNVNFPDDDGDADQYELDGYFGWGMDLTEAVALDLGYVYYHYGQLESGSDFGEIYANVDFWWFTAGVAYTTNSQVDDPDDELGFVDGDLFYHGDFAIDLTEDWGLGLTVGYYDYTNDGGGNDLSYTYGQADLIRSGGDFGDFTFSVSQAGEEANGGNGNAKVFISWVKGF